MLQKNEITPLITTATILFFAAIMGKIFSATSWQGMLSLAFAIFAYIILPGYFVMLNFKLTSLERIIFGMPISISLVSITLYTVDIIGIAISRRNTLIIIFGICILSILLRKKFGKQPACS